MADNVEHGEFAECWETELHNRLVRDLFLYRYRRAPDPTDSEDQARLEAIDRWLLSGARLPGELPPEAEDRCARIRAIRELTAGG